MLFVTSIGFITVTSFSSVTVAFSSAAVIAAGRVVYSFAPIIATVSSCGFTQ